jgi:transcriptional regulator with XRE-family HTH domain
MAFDIQVFAQRFGEELALWMVRTGRHRKDFADLVKVNPQTVANWKEGLHAPGSDKIEAIATELGVSVDYLLLLTDDRRPPDLTTAERVIAALRTLVAPDSEEERQAMLSLYERVRGHPLHGRGELTEPERPE